MGKSSKKFVPPLKSSQNLRSDENELLRTKTHRPKGGCKKLVINFDYAKIKQKCLNKQKAKGGGSGDAGYHGNQRSKVQEQSHDQGNTEEFMWFEPIQSNRDAGSPTSDKDGRSESSQQGHKVQSTHQATDDRGTNDVYLFPSSPTKDEKEAQCVACHLEKKEEKKRGKKKMRKDGKKTRKPPAGHIKKSVKKQVLKNLFKMGEDMAMLRRQEKALQGSGDVQS